MQREAFGFLKVIPIWVALMSGVFSIFREVASLYAPTQTVLWGKSVFWACVWVTFVFSSLSAWYLKHRELETEKVKSLKPDIKGEIEEVHTLWTLPQVETPGEVSKSAFECLFTLKARIFNIQPVPTTVRFELWVQAPRATCKTLKSSLSGLLFKHEQHSTGSFVRISKMQPVVEEMPDLESLGRTPLTMGDEREGWLHFRLPKADNPIRRDIEWVRLVVKDIYGGTHTLSSHRSEWRQTGEIITKFDEELRERSLKELETNLL